MIILQLRAANVLKYSALHLTDIPAVGPIAISGPNESGKTAIVETLCFALFGRTFSLDQDNIGKVIKWGESSCWVELDFTSADGRRFRVKRSLDNFGTYSAVLISLDQNRSLASGPQSVSDTISSINGFGYQEYLDSLYLAQREISTPRSQSSTIKGIAGGSDLEAVLDQLGEEIEAENEAIANTDVAIAELQQQIDALGIQDNAIENIMREQQEMEDDIRATQAEIVDLEAVSQRMQNACSTLQNVGGEFTSAGMHTSLSQWVNFSSLLSQSMQSIEGSCQALETDSQLCAGDRLKRYLWELQGRLSAFDAVRERINAYRAKLAALLGESAGAAEIGSAGGEPPLPAQYETLTRRSKRTRFWGVFTQIAFILVGLTAVAGWTGWWLLDQQPVAGYGGMANEWMAQHYSWWSSEIISWLWRLTIIAGIVAIVLLISGIRLNKRHQQMVAQLDVLNLRITDMRRRAAFIDAIDEMPLPEALQGLRKLENEFIGLALDEFEQGPASPLIAQDALRNYQARLAELLGECAVDVGDLRESIASETGAMNHHNEERRVRVAALNGEIDAQRALLAQANRLREAIEEQRQTVKGYQDRIALLELARKLVSDSSRVLYARFNQVLRHYTGDVMPKLTAGRYSQMQIDDNLGVRVFSNEKNDFAELGEFSSGTQRQMMLAVRLAMSKALIEATGQQEQFIILDEPFAFFDRERIDSTLEALPRVDERMKQVWIISQEFQSYDEFTLHLECSRDTDEMYTSESSKPESSVQESRPAVASKADPVPA